MPSSLSLMVLVPWIISHGYFIFFIATIVEGTLVTTAAGVACSFGYYNIVFIILIAIAGDLIADTIYYFIGYHSRSMILEKYGHHFGITSERIEKVGKLVHKHFVKTMIVVKLSPFIPVPGLIAIGASRVSLKKFIKASLLITAPKAIFFAFLGYYSGRTYIYITDKIQNGTYIAGILILLIIIIYIVYQKITSNLTKESGIE